MRFIPLVALLALSACCATPTTLTPATLYTSNPSQTGFPTSLGDLVLGDVFHKPICCPEDCKVVCPEGWKVCEGESQQQPLQMFVAPANARVTVEPREAVAEKTADIPEGAQILSRTVTRYEGGEPVEEETTDGDE